MKRFSSLAFAVLMLTLAASGCGDDDSSDETSTADRTDSTDALPTPEINPTPR